MNQKTAILIGATGLTGRLLLARLDADEVFCCIGTTSAKTKDRTVYKDIDADCIASAMINLAKSKPDMQIVNSDIIQEFGSQH